MTLHEPVCITSRLLAGVCIRDEGKLTEISIEFNGQTSDGRARYRYYIDGDGLEHSNGNDLRSGVGGGSLQQGLENLLAFLGAAAESYAYRLRTGHSGENEDLFPPAVVEWAYQHSDELSMLQLELEETRNLIGA